jgi:hypothetical protein
MFRLVVLAAVTYCAYRIALRAVEENQTRALLAPPSPDNRPPVRHGSRQASVR